MSSPIRVDFQLSFKHQSDGKASLISSLLQHVSSWKQCAFMFRGEREIWQKMQTAAGAALKRKAGMRSSFAS